MQQEIHFVTGKGGVGKSLVAAGLAYREAQKGRRVLLVELSEKSFYQIAFGLPSVTYTPTLLEGSLYVAMFESESCLREYALHLLKSEALYRLFFQNAVSRALIDVAPGLKELTILGKITSGPRNHGPPAPFDVLVVDAYSTGHFLALMRAPGALAQAVKFGPMGEQSRSIDRTIRDLEICRYHIVCLAEDLPVQESVELHQTLVSEFCIQPQIWLNKTVSNFTEDNCTGEFARWLAGMKQKESKAIQRLKDANMQVRLVPLFLTSTGMDLMSMISRALA
ncbi:MAG: arsenical pump-driving ATPase [Bdellovibrionaceae bacterium]|nr:arsenical pump-driving ATPase [Pseudobdellovibrionaceae bacterium]